MLQNAFRIYKITAGQILPERLAGNPKAIECISNWQAELPHLVGLSRTVCEKMLREPVSSICADRWEARRLTALKKVFLDCLNWESGFGEIPLGRLLSVVNSHSLFPSETVRDCFSLPTDVLNAAAAQFGCKSAEEFKPVALSKKPSKLLMEVPELSSESIVHRYDLAQLQATLYNCQDATVELETDFKHFIRAARLSGFSLSVAAKQAGYIFKIGPTVHFRGPKGYGCGLSKLAVTLIGLRNWKMAARFEDRAFNGVIQFSSADGYLSAKPPPKVFDSSVEEKFWHSWHKQERAGWILSREPRVFTQGQKLFCPDFEAQKQGRRVPIEIVGKNDPGYYGPKLESLRSMLPPRSVLVVKRQLVEYFSGLSSAIVSYISVPDPSDVVRALEELASTP